MLDHWSRRGRRNDGKEEVQPVGFIGIDRGIEEHWIYQDAEYFKVWFEILLRARYSAEPEKKLIEGKLITIEYGQFIFGRVSWSERLRIGEQRLRTLFKKMIDDGMIELVQKFPKFSLYSVKNYAKFNQQGNHQNHQAGQAFDEDDNQHANQQLTSSQPAPNQQLTTQEQGSNKVNKVKKEKINKIHYAEFVSLTEEEYQKLNDEYGEDFIKEAINVLNSYKGANGKKYKSDYLAMLNWVINRVREERAKVKPFQPRTQQRGLSGKQPIHAITDRTAKQKLSEEEMEAIIQMGMSWDKGERKPV